MERILRRDLDELLVPTATPCVSIYIAFHLVGRESQQDAGRLRKLIDEAEEQLVDRGMFRKAARALLEPARSLKSDAAAWQKRGRWMAMFLAPGIARMFQGSGKMDEALFVDAAFHLRPLLPLVSERDHFFLLALSHNSVRMFEGNSGWLEPLALPDLPTTLEAALNIDEGYPGFQVHAATRGGEGGKQGVVFHGQGGKPAEASTFLEAFVRRVAAVVDRHLIQEKAPLVLATVAANVPVWKSVSEYKHTMDDFIAGCPDALGPAELHAAAWPLVQPVLDEERDLLHRRITHAQGNVSLGLKDVVPAAMNGRVDTLFIDCTRPRWGHYDPEQQAIELHEKRENGDADLVELAAIETLRHRGQVYALARESNAPEPSAEALLRY
ncbi:MAG TPA: hypothetical protein VFV87_11200 [Pirellulaceae bacterium]|nr:hypothetical protein [Pirellulaceae bacterium]